MALFPWRSICIRDDASHEHGVFNSKKNPAETNGGVNALKSFAGPFPTLRYCPSGGVSLAKLGGYLSLNSVCCVGGTCIAPTPLVKEKQWQAITAICRDSMMQKKISSLLSQNKTRCLQTTTPCLQGPLTKFLVVVCSTMEKRICQILMIVKQG